MDYNGLTELHRDHVVFQELFWTETIEWRDEMDNFCGISRICNYLTYNFNGKMSHRRHLNTKQFLERKLINSLKNNNFFSNLKNQAYCRRENRNTIITARARSVPLTGRYYHDEMLLPYLPTISQTKIAFWVDRLLAV